MATARDWLKTLWSASFKGVPFFVEKDDETGGRRIVKHQFPMRDTPYLEDLGEDVREFEVTAYVASDSADGDAASVVAICATRGPGTLVLPTHGPILVRCLNFARDRSKDRHGYIALRLSFIREGASSALASVASLANFVFIQADSMALTAALSFAGAIQFSGVADYVQEAAIGGIQDNAAALEAIRTSTPVESAVSSAQRIEIQSIFDTAPSVTATPVLGAGVYATPVGRSTNSPAADLAARVIASARALGDALPAGGAVTAFEATFVGAQITVPAPAFQTPNTLAEASNVNVSNQAMRLAALTAYSEAVARIRLNDRPAAITLRANVAEYFESELLVTSAADVDLAHALMKLRDAVVDYLTRSIIDLAPVIQLEANMILPSLFWAWRLYADPMRSSELVARNKIPHPSFVPEAFEALAK